jgi:multiple sugar transport system substrate-binding protein
VKGSYLPTLKELYDDRQVTEAVPVVALAKGALRYTKPRPVTPYYSDMSVRMAGEFNASLQGNVSPEQAVRTLSQTIRGIVDRGKAGS